MVKNNFSRCCAKEIRRIWTRYGGPTGVLSYAGDCPTCGHFIGITRTPELEADLFLIDAGLEPLSKIKTNILFDKN